MSAYIHLRTQNTVICIEVHSIHSLSKLIVVASILLFTVNVIKFYL